MMTWCRRSGRETLAAMIVLTGLTVSVGNLTACSLFTKANARTALDVASIACAIAHAESSDDTVAQVCGIADALLPDLRIILAEQRKQLAKAKRAGTCVDGGAP